MVPKVEHYSYRTNSHEMLHIDSGNCWLLVDFAPELETADRKFSRELIEVVHINITFWRFPDMIKSHSEQLAGLHTHHWMRTRKERDFFTTTETRTSQIGVNSVDAVNSSLSSSSFTVDGA
jgi:hypothetical protein